MPWITDRTVRVADMRGRRGAYGIAYGSGSAYMAVAGWTGETDARAMVCLMVCISSHPIDTRQRAHEQIAENADRRRRGATRIRDRPTDRPTADADVDAAGQ